MDSRWVKILWRKASPSGANTVHLGLVWRWGPAGLLSKGQVEDMTDEIPIACCLSNEELRTREATLLAQFKSALVTTEELADGYLFRIPGDKKWLAAAAELIAAERECCPFLRFELIAEPGMGPVTVRMTGPPGTKLFLESILV
jgi:hypothetical protein